MRKPIVILGGMGPQASLRFHQLLIEKSMRYHNGDGDRFPYIVHFSLPVADFISDSSLKAAAAKTINQLADTIKSLHPGQLALACNTAHALITEVDILQRPPFVNMLEVAAQNIAGNSITKIGLLASPVTIRSRLYADVLAKQGIATIAPTPSQQRMLERAIRAVIAGEASGNEQRTLTAVARSLVRRGAQGILLGCTELPLIFDAESVTVPAFDCLDLYAEALIRKQYCIMEAR
jgi:aspartate racemase